MNPEFEVIGWSEREDGSSVLVLEMNFDMLVVFARKGMQALTNEAVKEYGYLDSEGTDNDPARDGRDQELFGEIPGL